MTRVNQPSKMPTRKVRMTAVGGAFAAVIMGFVNAADSEMYQSLMQPGFEAGLATLIAVTFGYMFREEM